MTDEAPAGGNAERKKVPQHLIPWSGQDYRTSRVRYRSARTGDYMLRLVYLEILSALPEKGGLLSSDPAVLADELMLPQEDIERCLPILVELGRKGRGGVVLGDDGTLSNRRMTEYLEDEREFRRLQQERGRMRAKQVWGEDSIPGDRSERLRQAREKGAHTKEQWEAIVIFCDHRCLACGVPASDLAGETLTKDHILPISQGGSDGVDNIQPLCRRCNSPTARHGDLRLSLPGFKKFIADLRRGVDPAAALQRHNSRSIAGQQRGNSPPAPSASAKRQAPREEVSAARPPSGERTPPLVFPCVAGKSSTNRTWGLSCEQVEAWQEIFPDMDILAGCREALGWVKSNRPKTAAGMPRFLYGWLERNWNRGTYRKLNGEPARQQRSAGGGAPEGAYYKRDTPEEIEAEDAEWRRTQEEQKP